MFQSGFHYPLAFGDVRARELGVSPWNKHVDLRIKKHLLLERCPDEHLLQHHECVQLDEYCSRTTLQCLGRRHGKNMAIRPVAHNSMGSYAGWFNGI